MPKYNEIVDSLKVIARDALRMEMVSKVQSEIGAIDGEINHMNEHSTEEKKNIARCDFAISQLVEADPDFADKKAEIEANKVEITKTIELIDKNLEVLKKNKEEKQAKITEIEEGKIKVSLEKLNALTSVYIQEVTKAAAVKKAAELAA